MTRKMKDSGIEWIGEIPGDWQLVPARYLFKSSKKIVGFKENEYERLSLTMKGVLKKSKYNSEGLQPSNFNSYQILNINQLVFKLIDLQNVSTSRVGISPYKGIVSPAYIIIDRKNDNTNNKFYYYWYMSMYLNKVFNLLGDAGVRSNINSTELLDLKVPRTSIKEQDKISCFLDKKTGQIEDIKSTIEEEIQTLEDYKKSVITEAVTKGLDKNVEMKDSGIEWIGKIPKHWETKAVKSITTKSERGTSPSYVEDSTGSKVVNQATFSQGFFDISNIRFSNIPAKASKGLLEKNDVLIASTGGGVLGKTHYFVEDDEYVADGHVTILRTNPLIQNSKILYYIFSVNFELINGLLAKGSTNQTELQSGWLKNFRVPCPPIEEQKQIADYLDKKTKSIDEAIEGKQKQLETLEEYKKSLIYEYVTGKKEVGEC